MNPVDRLMSELRGVKPSKVSPKGKFIVEHIREGKVIGTYEFPNDVTNEGKNLWLDIMFNTATQIANNSWFIGLINNSGFSALAAADTMASHAGWAEFTAYSQSTRVAWGSGAASSQSVVNGTAAVFDISGSGTVYGIFLTSVSTKGGTTGKLWATAAFGAPVPVVNADQLKVTYTVNS